MSDNEKALVVVTYPATAKAAKREVYEYVDLDMIQATVLRRIADGKAVSIWICDLVRTPRLGAPRGRRSQNRPGLYGGWPGGWTWRRPAAEKAVAS